MFYFHLQMILYTWQVSFFLYSLWYILHVQCLNKQKLCTFNFPKSHRCYVCCWLKTVNKKLCQIHFLSLKRINYLCLFTWLFLHFPNWNEDEKTMKCVLDTTLGICVLQRIGSTDSGGLLRCAVIRVTRTRQLTCCYTDNTAVQNLHSKICNICFSHVKHMFNIRFLTYVKHIKRTPRMFHIRI